MYSTVLYESHFKNQFFYYKVAQYSFNSSYPSLNRNFSRQVSYSQEKLKILISRSALVSQELQLLDLSPFGRADDDGKDD